MRPTRARRASGVLLAGAWLLSGGCASRPVPHLERAMSGFEHRYEQAREIQPLQARLSAYRSLRGELVEFRSSLVDEAELDPEARVHASSDYGGGVGWLRVDRLDVESIRQRSARLLRSLDRYLEAHPEPSVPGSAR